MRWFLHLVLFAACIQAAAASTEVVTAADWSRPRSGDSLLALPALKTAVNELLATPGSTLQIRYPGGDEGSLWGQELKAWLLALGIGSDRIWLVPGSAAADRLELDVVPAQ